MDDRDELRRQLAANLRAAQRDLIVLRDELAQRSDAHAVYRWLHQSFKLFDAPQDDSRRIIDALNRLDPAGVGISHPDAATIVEHAVGHTFDMSMNHRWFEMTAPIIGGYLHLRMWLDLAITAADTATDNWYTEEWAAILHLFRLR